MLLVDRWFWLKAVRILLFVALVFLAFVTGELFLFTGKPVPRSIEPLGPFEGHESFCISACGRIGIVPAAGDEDLRDLTYPMDVWELWPQKKIATIRCQRGFHGEALAAACLNLEKGLLATTAGQYEVWRWPEGKLLFKHDFLGGCDPDLLALSRDGTRLIICTENYAARLFDAETGTRLDPFLQVFDEKVGSGPPIIACYFDAHDQPKAIVFDQNLLAIWDIATNQKELVLPSASAPQNIFASLSPSLSMKEETCLVNPATSALATGHENGRLMLWSLDSGSLMAEWKLRSSLPCYPLRFSPDGRYLAAWQIGEHSLVSLVRKESEHLADEIAKLLPPETKTTLVDVQTGTQWPGLPGTRMCAFAPDGSTFLTWDEKLTVWDLPPKWSYFSPWAWFSLGGWVLLAAVWRATRRKRIGPTKD